MRSNVLKVSALAATIAASFGAQAAVYEVHKVDTPRTDVLNYGVAVGPSSLDCWVSDKCDSANNSGPNTPDTFYIAVESKKNLEGYSYRDESPFFLVNGFDYLEDNFDGFRNYCDEYLDYNSELCDKWARERWNGYNYELGSNYDNSLVYVDENTTPVFTENTVINEIVLTTNTTGNRRDTASYPGIRNVGFSNSVDLTAQDLAADNIFKSSHAWRSIISSVSGGSKTYVVGSVTRDVPNIVNSADTVSKAAVWDISSPADPVEIDWESGTAVNRDRIVPQGSARDITEIVSTLYAVGYNSDNEERLRASVFSSTDGTTWISRFVSPPLDIDALANYTLQVVNKNKLAVGTYKLKGSSSPQNGSLSNGLFYTSDVTSATPSSSNLTGGIFFTGANGLAGGLNDKNEFVGQIDLERHSETNGGKPRAKRAFATVIGDTQYSSAAFKNGAYYLDDLTYGLESNNAYRIFDATDINEASVISGSAYYCPGGYDSYAIDATCNGGAASSEQVVAVKLIPIQGTTAANIQSRPQEEVAVERQGASLGWLALGLLGLLGFRRK